MTELAVAGVRMSWKDGFLWRRAALGLVVVLVPAGVCFALGHGLLGLILFAAAALPWRVHVAVSASGVTLRWLWIRQMVAATEVTSVELVEDPRRFAWPRRRVLVLERRSRPPVLVFGSPSVLDALARAWPPNA